MRKTILFIAMSLDGYIAEENGGVDWLVGDGSQPDHPGSYPRFYESIDTIILGYTTYHQIATELFPEKWIYEDKLCYICTHKKHSSTSNMVFTDTVPGTLVHTLKQQPGHDIWICGGALLANQLIQEDLIDRYHISIIPTILGKGISLFQPSDHMKNLTLISTEQYNGIVDCVYEKRSV